MSIFLILWAFLLIPAGIIHITTKDDFLSEDMYFSVKDEHRIGWIVTIIGLICLIAAFALGQWH